MKRQAGICTLLFLAFTAVISHADSIPYPSLGKIAPQVSTYAASGGGVTAYFAGTDASFTDYVEILDLATGYSSGPILNNHTSAIGQSVSVGTSPGQINAGDQLLFYIDSPECTNFTFCAGGAKYASLGSYSADGINHAYITAYTGGSLGGGIPQGIYVGTEDEPNGGSDFSYNDDSFVFTGISAPSIGVNPSVTPEPGTLMLFGTGAVGIGMLVQRRKKLMMNC